MPSRSGPSTTRIVLTLAGIAVGGTVALFGISAAVGLVSGPPAVKVPVKTVAAAGAASASSVPATTTPTARMSAPSSEPKPATALRQTKPVSKAATRPKPRPAPRKLAPKPKHVAALPDKLKTLGAARQVVVVTSPNKASNDGTLELYDLRTDGDWTKVMSAPTRMGRNGLVAGSSRHQGSSMTPTGSWAMPTWGFGWAGAAPSGSRLGWKQIRSNSYWSAEHRSSYNTWVTSSSGIAGERLKSAGPSYEFAIDSGYNALPNARVYGRGTAIFIHVMHPGYTAGCISIPRAKMIELLKRLDPARKPRCVIGTTDRGSSTSIYAY